MRPIASCTVAVPNCASAFTAARSARVIVRLTTPSSVMLYPLPLPSLGLQRLVQARIDTAHIAFINVATLIGIQILCRLDVALRVVKVMTGLWVNATNRADHLAGKQDILGRDDPGQKIDARLVVDARIEENVAQKMVAQQGLLE